MDETASGNHGDADVDVVSLALGWACLALTSVVLGLLPLPWIIVLGPVLLPHVIKFAAGLYVLARERWAA